MKIFFHAPITPRMIDTHRKFYEYIQSLGHEHTTDFAVKLNPEDLSSKEIRKQAKIFLRNQELTIKKADIVVLGATEQSIGTGMYMNMATHLSKPIVALTEKRNEIPFLYDALDYPKLLIFECNDANYKQVIPKALAKAKKLVDKRFTLLLPPDVVEMLDMHYHTTGETRSEYIRDLIRNDIEKRKLLTTRE